MRIVAFDDVLKAGEENTSFKVCEPTPDSCYMLSYTSGTTGAPKGVKLTHRMMAGVLRALQHQLTDEYRLDEQDVYISYLPYAHIFEQVLYAAAVVYGMRIGYYSGDVQKIVSDDLPVLQPTFFPAVPRLFNRLYGVIQDKLKATAGCKGWLLQQALAAKYQALEGNGTVTHGCWDSVVLKKVQAVLGGRVRKMLTGSAPLSKEVMNFFKVAFSAQFFEAYGMTETCGASVLTTAYDNLTGHVGGPVANVKIRLRDIPEQNYLSTDSPARGEICFWGGSIMKGYFKNPEKTAEALTKDGWMLSGDVGIIYANGQIKVIDRVKNIFKLSQGEYISPEKVENVLIQSDYLLQTFVHGESTRDYCVLVAVVDPPKLKAWAEQAGKKEPIADLVNHPVFVDLVYADCLRLGNQMKLNSLEKPKQIFLTMEPFTVENEILTSTSKLKRP